MARSAKRPERHVSDAARDRRHQARAGEGLSARASGDRLLDLIGGHGTITYDGRICPTAPGEIYMVEGGVRTPSARSPTTSFWLSARAPADRVGGADRMAPVEYPQHVKIDKLECLICGVSVGEAGTFTRSAPDAAPCPCCLPLPRMTQLRSSGIARVGAIRRGRANGRPLSFLSATRWWWSLLDARARLAAHRRRGVPFSRSRSWRLLQAVSGCGVTPLVHVPKLESAHDRARPRSRRPGVPFPRVGSWGWLVPSSRPPITRRRVVAA